MLHLRQCAVAMDTWRLLVTSQSLILLDLVFNTQKMTVGMTKEYRWEVQHLMDTMWHPDREAFTANEMELLVGKLRHIGQAHRPIYHLMPHMYASVALYCITMNNILHQQAGNFANSSKLQRKIPQYLRILARSMFLLNKQLNWYTELPNGTECPIHWNKRLQ